VDRYKKTGIGQGKMFLRMVQSGLCSVMLITCFIQLFLPPIQGRIDDYVQNGVESLETGDVATAYQFFLRALTLGEIDERLRALNQRVKQCIIDPQSSRECSILLDVSSLYTRKVQE